jgi:MFS family permease
MGFGYLAFGSVDEPEKEKVSQREKRFSTFLKNSIQMLKDDRDLQIQITTFLFAYSYLISLPFIILDAQERIDLNGTAIGMLITSQMIGAMLSNLVWGRLMSKGYYRLSTNIALLLHVSAVIIAFNAGSVYEYIAIFFIVGAATDGNRIASGNLILIVAPPEKRPVYVALQMNIISLGMFFSIFGGFILHVSSYNVLYTITLLILMFAFFVSLKLKDE